MTVVTSLRNLQFVNSHLFSLFRSQSISRDICNDEALFGDFLGRRDRAYVLKVKTYALILRKGLFRIIALIKCQGVVVSSAKTPILFIPQVMKDRDWLFLSVGIVRQTTAWKTEIYGTEAIFAGWRSDASDISRVVLVIRKDFVNVRKKNNRSISSRERTCIYVLVSFPI